MVNISSAAEFASIQCHIQFGDFQEEKHKPGFIENLSEYLPAQYCSSWGIDKKISKEYSKHVGLNELEAKHLYTKTARGLPTYGVTFFLVKEKQKGKKKLVPRLLGISADAVLRLDEVSKEVLQQWPLTHVKTYHAGKGETFTLNFGDYSDKEYSVKTRDAYRIRDILEGYIDLIRKRMLANYNQSKNEHGYVSQDNVSSGQASMVQHISNNPMKIVEQSFVGPSKIVQYEPGQNASQGTQMVTVQEIVTSSLINNQGKGVKSEVLMRTDMSMPFTRRLNRLNSSSVKIVTLLTEPSQANIEEAQRIVAEMNAEMPFVQDGVKETAANQRSEDEKTKLREQLHMLEELLKTLSASTQPGGVNASEAEDAAKQIADLTTQMYFAMDPRTQRRSRIISSSRRSFIADERTEKTLRRASFIAASATTNHALNNAEELITLEYKGPPLDAKKIEELEASAVDKLGKINAAIAHYLLAHSVSEPDNIDYGAAVNSLNIIHELMPELAKDAQALASCQDGMSRRELVADVRQLCRAARHLCAQSGVQDKEKLQEASSKYANVAGKLVYAFSKGSKERAKKENEVIELAQTVGAQTSVLLASARTLTELAAQEAGAAEVDAAGARTAAAARNLLAQAQLNAPTIDEPHCQSALTAASESLSSSAQLLAASWRPLVDHPSRHQLGEKLHSQTMDLARALDRLMQCYDSLDDVEVFDETPKPGGEAQRLKFVNTLSKVGGTMQAAEDDLNKPVASQVKDAEAKEAQLRLSSRLGQLNAAIASLLAATADRENPDYAKAELAVSTINELMPEVVKDSKTATANHNETARAALLDSIRSLCTASKGICASAYGAEPEGLDDAVSKYSEASGKLTYVFNRRASPEREEQILELSTGACSQTGVLLSGVTQLVEAVGGELGGELDSRGADLADSAQALLNTVRITAQSITDPQCQSSLLSSIDKVSTSGKKLAETWAPLANDPKKEMRVQALNGALKQLEAQLNGLRDACQVPSDVQSIQDCQMEETQSVQGSPQNQQKVQFIRTINAAKGRLADAQKELDKPAASPAPGADVDSEQARLARALAQLNAALASLLTATADSNNSDYAAAEKAATTIADLMPQVIRDTKTVSAGKDEATRAAMLAQVKELCEASEGICAGSDGINPQGFNDAVAKFTDASGKLVYAFSPRVNPNRENQIVGLSSAACSQASQLLSGVQQLAGAGVGGGEWGRLLGVQGGRVAAAARALLQVAPLTAGSQSSQCREALLSSVEQVSAASRELAASLALQQGAAPRQQAQALRQALERLLAQLDALRKACNTTDNSPPSVSNKPQPPSGAHKRPTGDITQDFLHRLRIEESMAQENAHQPPSPAAVASSSPSVIGAVGKVKPAPPPRTTDDDKRLHHQFITSVGDAEKSIKENEAMMMKACRLQSGAGAGAALPPRDLEGRQAALQRNLALAGVEVARLVAANYADKIDYAAASKSTKLLPQLMTSIVQDGKQLSDNVNDMARKAFLYDMLQLCGASRKICDAARSDRLKLNEAAVHFGDTSAKLLYVVSNDVDPDLEKEIISRAKAIGDSASRLALDAAGIATAASGTAGSNVQEICDAGTACVDAAGKLVYTAKLTAPSIHETPCRSALVASTENLSNKLKAFSDSWKPLSSDPQQAKTVKDLTKEANNLERILEGLRSDVRGGKIGKRREMEQLLVEDTPMRQLTAKILDHARMCAESADLPVPQKIVYAAYADKLKDALRALDLANARCKKTPHDTNKRRELENAIQNLQMTLLQSRPRRGDKGQSNIVDLRDFIEEVSSDAKNLSAAASGVSLPAAQDKRTLEEIKAKCGEIEAKAYKLMNVESRTDLDTTYDDVLGVDQFGQECDDLIKEINADLKGMEDAKAKRLLLSKILPLSESCNMLRFATKSDISTEASASLESSLDNLDDIEARVIPAIVRDSNTSGVTMRSQPPLAGISAATINLCREVASSSTGVASSTVIAYIADAAARTDTANPEEKNKLLKHVYKLVHLLRTLTVTQGMRAAAWRAPRGGEVAAITEQILQEIYSPESKLNVRSGDTKSIIDEQDITKLLIPSTPIVLASQKQQEQKLVQLSSKLSSMSSAMLLGVSSPTSLARSAHAAVGAALELDAIARGCRTNDPVQSKRIDEAATAMSFATYNVLKTAESASQDPNNQNLRRKLLEACEKLDQSIDKLSDAAPGLDARAARCGAAARGAARRLAALRPRAASAAAFRAACDHLDTQKEHIYKLKSDEAMPRVEFIRSLDDIGSALHKSTECATQCAYYIAVSDQHKDIAKTGLVDVPHIQKSIESIQDSCMAIIGSSHIHQAREEREDLHKRIQDLSGALDKAQVMVKDGEVKKTLVRARSCVSDAAEHLVMDLKDDGDMSKITPKAVSLLEAVNQAHCMIDQCPLVPRVGDMSADTRARCDEVMDHSKTLLTSTLTLLKDVNSSPEEPETMTWVTYNTSRKKLLEAYDALVKCVKRNGHRAGIFEKAPEEEEVVKKSYIEIQVDLANRWLKSPACKADAKDIGQQAVRNVVDMARRMSEDLKGTEREDVRSIITETDELLCECAKKYDHEKNMILMDRIKELKKAIQRGVVTRVVEDFIEAEAPLANLDLLADAEKDESKRKFILERKIASLLAQLGRVRKTARFVADSNQHLGVELTQCSEQTELLAPMLVQAAQQRIDHPDDKATIDKYKALLAQYAESISAVRDLCDRAVDPMDFVQTAGDTMQRMREDMTQHNNDPQKCAYASSAITKLANRVINVSMSSDAVRSDPSLARALAAARRRLLAAARAGRRPDWRETTAEILRTTGDVESTLGGENIFKKQPTTANQPIYSVARELHESVREWSSRDNEIVGVARRMAVLMARLSEYMETDKTESLIATSKSIVVESQEVAELAKKLAHECTDVRIKTNLLQTCERIPTISGQLKMLTTVKGSSLGHQGSTEDKEAMDMLVVNAQSLMMSIQEVVKAAAGASVKIMSQRGPRLRWVRKNYY